MVLHNPGRYKTKEFHEAMTLDERQLATVLLNTEPTLSRRELTLKIREMRGHACEQVVGRVYSKFRRDL